MVNDRVKEAYLESLLEGNRAASRKIVEDVLHRGIPAHAVYMDLVWPIMVEVDVLFRNDKIDTAQEAMATRINRTIVDQLQNKLPIKESRNRKIVVANSGCEQGELGGQMTADLFESDGWDVRFLGASVGNDDIVKFVHDFRPEILLIYGTKPSEAPDVRALIDTVKAIGTFPEMKIMVSGGLFNRAEGLWEEIGADMYAPTAQQALKVAAMDEEDRKEPVRVINRRKRTKDSVSIPQSLLEQLAS